MNTFSKKYACIDVTNSNRKYKVDRKRITILATEIARRLGIAHYEICVLLTTPRGIRKLNKQYRAKDKSTDVLSFPQYQWKRPLKYRESPPSTQPVLNPLPLGDIVISIDDAHANALESKHDLAQEICFLLIHGILHLVGHDHMKPREKKLMFGEQRKFMRLFKDGLKSSAKTGDSAPIPAWKDCVKPHARVPKPRAMPKARSAATRTSPKGNKRQ